MPDSSRAASRSLCCDGLSGWTVGCARRLAVGTSTHLGQPTNDPLRRHGQQVSVGDSHILTGRVSISRSQFPGRFCSCHTSASNPAKTAACCATAAPQVLDILPGVSGGVARVMIGQPFDTIKTRLQVRPLCCSCGQPQQLACTTTRPGGLAVGMGSQQQVALPSPHEKQLREGVCKGFS